MMKKTIGSMLMGLCAASALNAQSPVTVDGSPCSVPVPTWS